MKIQKFLKTIWNEFVYGGHLISLGAVSVVFTSSILLNINITWDSLLVTYLGCQIIYLYNRYKEFNIDFLTNPERTKHTEKYIRYIPLIIFIFSLLAIGILIYFEKFHALIFGFFLVFLGLLYSLFLKKLTKKIIGFKNFFVTLIWASLVIFLAFNFNFYFYLYKRIY
jgi:4-hydroxybenzoate polyprenyltransferase